MSSAGQIEKLYISKINSEKRINIILKDFNNNVIYTETVKYNEKKYKTCLDIANYICNKFDYKPGLCCNYDEATQSNYIYYNSKANGDFINWKIDFDNIDIKDAFKGQSDNSITVTMVNVPYGLGNADAFQLTELFELLIALIKYIIWLVRYCLILINPYKNLQKKFHRDREFIDRTISLGKTWKCGFISNDEFEFKKTIEKTIMKKLGYKKKNDNWIKVDGLYK